MSATNNKNCPEQEAILAYSEGALNAEDARVVNEHLLSCDICMCEFLVMKKDLQALGDKRVPLPETLKAKALQVATGGKTRALKSVSEFVLSMTDKGVSFISSLLLPEDAVLNILHHTVPAVAFRSDAAAMLDSLILEETVKGITIKVLLMPSNDLFITVRVFLIRNSRPVQNERLSIYQGDLMLSSKLTAIDGCVEFPHIAYGYYAVKVPSEDIEIRFRIYPEDMSGRDL